VSPIKGCQIQLQHFSLYNQLLFIHCVYIPHMHCLNVSIHHEMVLFFWVPFLSWKVFRFACIHGDVVVFLQVPAKEPFACKILFTFPKLASKPTCITHQLMFFFAMANSGCTHMLSSSKDSTSTLVIDFRKIENKKVRIKILSTLTKCILIVASITCWKKWIKNPAIFSQLESIVKKKARQN
jgi:hypothetical protein